MVRGGMNLARVNMSHGSREDHRTAIESVRAAAEAVSHPVAVLVDLVVPMVVVLAVLTPLKRFAGLDLLDRNQAGRCENGCPADERAAAGIATTDNSDGGERST